MARYSIISKDGASVRFTGCPVYNGAYLSPAYLDFREIASPFPIEWEVGDYVVYDRIGLTFKLYYLPKPKKQANAGFYGAAFVYENVQLYAATKDLELTPFRDFVPDDNGIHFSSRSGVSTYQDVKGIAERIQACMDALHPGEWQIRVAELPEDTGIGDTKEVSITGSCLNALQTIYDTWGGIGWCHTVEQGVNVVTVGAPNIRTRDNTTDPFLYGKGQGLKVLRMDVTNRDEMATRIYPFGSERNMPNRYYNKFSRLTQTPVREYESVDIPNLMVPVSYWGQWEDAGGKMWYDPSLAYYEDSAVVQRYGIIPKRVYFDGSDGNEEIYPTIERVTVDEVRAEKGYDVKQKYYPLPYFYPDKTQRVDEVLSAQQMADPGYTSDSDGKKYKETSEIEIALEETSVALRETKRIYSGPNPFSTSGRIGTENIIPVLIKTTTAEPITLRANINLVERADDGTYNLIETGAVEVLPSITKVGVFYYMTFRIPSFSTSGSGKYEFGTDTRIEIYITPIPAISGTYNVGVSIEQTTVTLVCEGAIPSTFTMEIPQIGFDLNGQATTGSGITLSMKSGSCAGRDFPVTACKYRQSTCSWLLTLRRSEDSSLNTLFPNNAGYQISPGDRFVILDIAMPEMYINIASKRLAEAAIKKYNDIAVETVQYVPDIDPIVMAREARHIREGMYMEVTDMDVIGGTDYVTVDSLTIDEGEAEIPTYKVTLRDKKRETLIETVKAIQVSNRMIVQTVDQTQAVVKRMARSVSSNSSDGIDAYTKAESDERYVLAGDEGEWYNVKLDVKGQRNGSGAGETTTSGTGIETIKTIVENYTAALSDSSKYRWFLLRWRKKGWRSAFLSSSENNNLANAVATTWQIDGRKQDWVDDDGVKMEDYPIATKARTGGKYVFKNTGTSTLRIGVAIYKNTGEGTFGWQRVSNIAYVLLRCRTGGEYSFKVRQE